MPTNIQSWNTLKLNNLSFPLAVIHTILTADENRRGWNIDQPKINGDGTVTITGSAEGFVIEGELVKPPSDHGQWDGNLAKFIETAHVKVTKIENDGEGSGSWNHYFMERLLEQTTGELTYQLFWDGAELETVMWRDGKQIDEDELGWVDDKISLPTADGVEWITYDAKTQQVYADKPIKIHVIKVHSDQYAIAMTRDEGETRFSHEFLAENMDEATIIQDAESLLKVLRV